MCMILGFEAVRLAFTSLNKLAYYYYYRYYYCYYYYCYYYYYYHYYASERTKSLNIVQNRLKSLKMIQNDPNMIQITFNMIQHFSNCTKVTETYSILLKLVNGNRVSSTIWGVPYSNKKSLILKGELLIPKGNHLFEMLFHLKGNRFF